MRHTLRGIKCIPSLFTSSAGRRKLGVLALRFLILFGALITFCAILYTVHGEMLTGTEITRGAFESFAEAAADAFRESE